MLKLHNEDRNAILLCYYEIRRISSQIMVTYYTNTDFRKVFIDFVGVFFENLSKYTLR